MSSPILMRKWALKHIWGHSTCYLGDFSDSRAGSQYLVDVEASWQAVTSGIAALLSRREPCFGVHGCDAHHSMFMFTYTYIGIYGQARAREPL